MAVTLPKDAISTKFPNLGSVITAVLPYIYVFAGLLMLVMIIMGGIGLMTSAGDPAKSKDGYGKITAGIIGFIIIFAAYFVAQIVQVVFGVKFL